MAAEAISRVKEAEDKGDEIIKAAMDKAKETLKNAEKEGDEKYSSIVDLALKSKEEQIQAAKAEAAKECQPIEKAGRKEREEILSKGSNVMANTVKLIVGRIVG